MTQTPKNIAAKRKPVARNQQDPSRRRVPTEGIFQFVSRRGGKPELSNRGKRSTTAAQNGGPDRDQTDDLVVANDALYQLSYWPMVEGSFCAISSRE